MALSSDLISQLVQVTNDVKTDKPSNVVYGTVVEYEGEKYVRIDGSERLTRAGKVTDTEVNDRVMVAIENHTATITGNISSPSARSQRVEELGGEIQKVAILVAGKVSTEDLIANYAKITDLTAQTARIDSLVAEDVVIEKRLDAAEAVIVTLDATYATIEKLQSDYATIVMLESEYTKTTELEATYATIKKLQNDYATITHLTANYAKIAELQAVDAKIGVLDNEVADINTLIFGSATGNTIQTKFANAVIAQLGDAQIKSAMIKDITAGQITSGDIITDNINVRSKDGSLLISDQTMQISSKSRLTISITGNTLGTSYTAIIKDAAGRIIFSKEGITSSDISNGTTFSDSKVRFQIKGSVISNYSVNVWDENEKLIFSKSGITSSALRNFSAQTDEITQVRVQIGKDASSDYSINIWDELGRLMFSKGGITKDAIKDKIIRNDMVSDSANISASKLNVNSLFDVINDDSSNTIKSTKVYLDEEGQTLDVSFKSMTTKIDGISVGGRNLVAGTSLDTVYSGVVAADSTLGYKDVWSAKTIDNADGTEYVVSFDAKADEEIDIRCFFYSPNTTLTSESSTGDRRGDTGPVITDGISYVHLTTEWKRYWVKWTQTPANDKKSVIIGRNSSQTNRVYIRAVKLEVGNKATDWTPAPEDIDAKTTELSTKYHNLNIDVGNLSSTIAEQSQLIEKKADGSTVTALSTKYSTLEQTVNGLSATVGSHTSQIANKADGSTVTALSEQYTALSADLSGFKTTVRDTYTTKTEFNNLEIGGRNLLLNTGGGEPVVLIGEAAVRTSGLTSSSNVDGIQTLNCSATYPTEIYYRFMTPNTTNLYGLELGGTYILSGKAKVSTTSGTLNYLTTRTQYNSGAGWTGGAATVILTEDSDEWVSFETKFTIESNATGYYVSLQLYFTDSWVGTIQLKNLKLEKGNKSTDWTPAPEDIDANISKSAETVTTQTAELLGSYATKVDLTGYYTKSQTESAIEEKANSITSTVASTYSTKADLAALEVGGRNLIAGTSKDTVYTKVFKTDGYTEGVTGKTIDIPADDEYVLSFDAKSTVNGDRIMCHFYSPNTTLNVEVSTNPGVITQKTDGAATLPVTTSWKRYWVKYTQNGASTTTTKSWIVGRLMAGNGTGTVSIRAIKLEEGHVPTDWTPAPEDVDTVFGSVRSEIQQLADSITLSVTGTLGSTASIKLTANGQTSEKQIDIDMSKVREAFANDNTAIDISAGKLTFNSGTLAINSTYFTLTSDGKITATSGKIGSVNLWENGLYLRYTYSVNRDCCGILDPDYNADAIDNHDGVTGRCFFAGAKRNNGTEAKFYVTNAGKLYAADADIAGTITTVDNKRKSVLSGASLDFYYDDVYSGSITSKLYSGATTGRFVLSIPNGGKMDFISESTAGGATPHYRLYDRPDDVVFDRNDTNTYSHHFITDVCFYGETYFTSRLTLNNWTYIKNRNGIGWYTSDGSQDQMISMGTDDVFIVGSKYHNAIFSGDILQLVADGQLQLKSSANTIIYSGASTTSGTSYFNHNTTGTCYLGASDKRWKQLYASTACNTSSDIRLKKNIVGLSDEHSELFDRLQPVQYNMIDGNDRIHYGFVAQHVASAMAELNIDEDELDLVQHDHWIDSETKEPCDEYGLVYDNFIAMLVHEVQKLKREIKTLKGE